MNKNKNSSFYLSDDFKKMFLEITNNKTMQVLKSIEFEWTNLTVFHLKCVFGKGKL